MRLTFLPLVLGGLAFGGDARCVAQSDVPPPLVVLVHGRGQFGLDSASTRREWKRDLDSALALVGMPRLRDEDVRLAWYADVLDPESSEACPRPMADRAAAQEDALGGFARLLLGTLSTLLAERDRASPARGLLGDILYFVDREARCAAEQRLAATLADAARERRPVIVVAYSLGALVAHGYLNGLTTEAPVPADLRLVTIGSPLGIPEVRALVLSATADSLRVPAVVKSWENVYDPDDLFAAPIADRLASSRARDRATQSPAAPDAHHIRRYLRDRSTGLAIGRALCAPPRRELAERCAALQ